MRLRCTYKVNVPVPERLIQVGYTRQTVFNVTFDRVYTVFAMALWKGELLYLLLNDETQRPDWFPAFCFEVVDDRVPFVWNFAYWGHDPSSHATAIWGYPEITRAGGVHYVALIEREPEAMEIFKARRKEIEAVS